MDTPYRLRTPIVGLPVGERHAVTIPAGAMLRISTPWPNTGYVTVWHGGRAVRVSATDLNDAVADESWENTARSWRE